MNVLYGEPDESRIKNRERLRHETYCAPSVFDQGGEWAGDWQGRTLLALACHYKIAPAAEEKKDVLCQAREILRQLPEHVNEGGYFGAPCDFSCVDEQQLSGNSWFLRGLCMWYEITSSDEIMNLIERITDSLLLRLASAYLRYPAVKREDGSVSGHLQSNVVDGWKLSTDVGCAFILLDGMTDVYEKTKSQELCDVIRTIIDVFRKIDYIACNCQTHATLSAARGILRFWQNTGEEKYLSLAESIFKKYCECGMTANYANFNWFGKPFWTEPCAVVDSLILATRLFRATHKYVYAQLADRIYLNAFRRAQRANGGAGCDSCLCESNRELKILSYEAPFCCTMRYAEGLLCLFENTAFEQDGTTTVLFRPDCVCGDMKITREYIGNRVRVSLQNPSHRTVRFYIPRHVCGVKSALNDFVTLEQSDAFEYEELPHEEILSGAKVKMQADAVLLKTPDGDYAPIDNGLHIKPEHIDNYILLQ